MSTESDKLRPLASDATCQLDVFGHDGDTLGVDGAQVGVFEQTHEVGFASFLSRVMLRYNYENVIYFNWSLFSKNGLGP